MKPARQIRQTLPVPVLSTEEQAQLHDLYRRGTPANTHRAWERDLFYISTWKHLRFASPPEWPETEETALRFLLDHSRDLRSALADDPARHVAEHLILGRLRRSLACPATATLDRRIASWRAFHRMRNLASPFETPLLRQARAQARRATDRPIAPKSQNPITRETLLSLSAAAGPGLRGLRDRAILLLGWASGGRRRSEIVSLNVEDLDLSELADKGLVWLQLIGTKTTSASMTPKLVLKGAAAQAISAWIDAAGLTQGPLFRRITRHDTVGQSRLSADSIALILRRLLRDAALPEDFASPHGLRSGFLTQAALDGIPLQAAMRLSLHRSPAQAQRYYADVTLAENPASDLLGGVAAAGFHTSVQNP